MSIELRVSAAISTRQRKLVTTFRTLRHTALDNRLTSRTRECSSIRYIECEAAFRTLDYVLLLSHCEITFASFP